MHVGHLRGTVIGDALCRMLTFVGHDVRRENHIGDWGTPFGMLIEHLVDLGEETAVRELSVGDLDTFYRQARASFDADETFRDRSRQRVVLLQSGDDEETLRLWRVLVGESVRYFDEVYAKLGVLLTDADIVGESFYNPMLDAVVSDLEAAGLLVESDGARCVFPPGFTNRNGDPLPLIVQKSDGGLRLCRHRPGGHPRPCRRAWVPPACSTSWAHPRPSTWRCASPRPPWPAGCPRASGPSTSRSAASSTATARRSRRVRGTGSGWSTSSTRRWSVPARRWREKNPDLDAATRAAVARMLGIGAIKYADLSTDRARDYVFDWERMLAFEGNTAPYLQYAHARIRSIFRRGNVEVPALDRPPLLNEPAERALALALLGFADVVASSLASWSPSRLCGYLFDLATTFTGFYENCPVLKAPTDELRRSRLALADLTARVLAQGLDLLGIEAPDQM